jgi:hypothetical protein
MPALSERDSRRARFGSLLATLLLLMLVTPFREVSPQRVDFLSVAVTLVLGAGVYAASRRRWVLRLGAALAVPTLAFEWVANFAAAPAVVLSNLLCFGAFVGFLAVVIFYEILQQTHVTLDTIFGGIAIYLLIGIGWAFVYSAVEHVAPGSYPLGGAPLQDLRPHFEILFNELVYFSFVTLTTLGYGDITPTTPPARTLAVLEAIVGQLYVAVFIASLVGLHLSERRHD